MAEDYVYITNTGVIVPDTAVLQTTVQNEYKAVFGTDLVVDPSTPQGVLITAETLARDVVVRNNAALANQINPNIAGGVFLDAICALTALQRDAATKSFVVAQLTGVNGTSIPEGSQAKTVNGDLFASTETGVIVDGSVEIPFQSVEFGAIAAPENTLTQIISDVLGWETINNSQSAVLGTGTQSDQSLRALRKNTLALQGVALPEAIISALYNVPEVRSLSFRENITNSTATIDGVSMVAHSIYACVDGGTDSDVAAALLANKSLGANWNGAEDVTVVDAASGQSYVVKFARPTPVNIKVRAYVRSASALVNPITATKNAIMDYANGLLEGEPGFTVGSSVSTFELAGAVNRESPGVYVQKIETTVISSDGDMWSTVEIPIGIDEIAALLVSNITVNII